MSNKYITTEDLNKLNEMTNELISSETDLDKTKSVLNDMFKVLGIQPKFTSIDEFDAFIESNEPLVIN